MTDRIIEKLNEIEKTENVKILYCAESGSRAWGFASPDSDYDVRFIYIRPEEFYLKLEKTKDVIGWQLDDTFDINGWDLQKMLRLLRGSNPTVFEWRNSPIVYRKSTEWNSIEKIIDACFQPKPCLYHYLSMAKNNYHTHFKTDTVAYKKYFYALRPIFACKWILDNNSPVPMLFSHLLTTDIPEDIRGYIDELLEIKINSTEAKSGKRIEVLDKFIEDMISATEEKLRLIPQESKPDWDILNRCFVSALKERS